MLKAVAFALLSGAQAGTSPAAVIRPIDVPAALLARTTNPELSGVVFSGRLQRYLVVSDDTGLREQDSNHVPQIYALDRAGRLDATPIPIAGIDELNDAESITAGPDDTFFVATSHSPNRKGKTPATRRQLLHLQLQGRSLRVLARLDLTQVAGGSLLEVAGQSRAARLDIEAITFHDNDLFIGLKSPQSADGKAIVLRLRRVMEVFGRGRLQPSDFEKWAELPLCVSREGQTVCQGIADMTFLADGSLVLAANAPKGGPKDGGGALWRAATPVGRKPPTLLQRFEGRKPEGVCLSADRQSLIVVFDTDRNTPGWTQLPLPR